MDMEMNWKKLFYVFLFGWVAITDSSVSVTVNKKELAQTDIAKICDIVIRETGRSANQIVIQNKA